jgi:eukaryotic-like serine/threonine-protein kinase
VKVCPTCKSSYSGKPPRCPLDGAVLYDLGPDLMGGRVVARHFRMIERCGAGATADVYRALDVKSGAVVAARVPTAYGADDAAQRERLTDQVRAFRAAAPHDMLVPVLDVLDRAVDGLTVVITEFVSTPALPHVLAAGPVPLDAALAAGVQIASLLEHLHAHDVLARDLRAGAVFLASTGVTRARLSIDALATGPTAAPDPVPAMRTLSPHMAAAYLCPERIRGEASTPAGDVYAFGALLFEMLTGHPAFQGDGPAVIAQHLDAPAPVLRQAAPALPKALEALLAKMFAKLPRFRPTPAEVRAALAALAG